MTSSEGYISRQARLAWGAGIALLIVMVPAGLYREWFALVWDWSALRFVCLVIMAIVVQFVVADCLPQKVVIVSGILAWISVFAFCIYSGLTLWQ